MTALRPGTLADAPAMAAIKNDWIDATLWMPRVHPADDLVRHHREHVLRRQQVTVAEDEGVVGFSGLDDEGFVTSLFVASGARGRGVGKALLDRAKTARPEGLRLWTFVANEGARRFYAREGFAEVERTDGENEERLPDVLMRWMG